MLNRKTMSALLLTLLVALLSFAAAGLAQAQDPLLQNARQPGFARVIVGLRADFKPLGEISAAQAQTQTANIQRLRMDLVGQLGANATVVRDSLDWNIPFVAMTVNEAGLRQLRQSPQVLSVQEDVLNTIDLNQSTQVVHAQEAWNYGYTGSGWAVAVLDTGVRGSHPMLAGKLVSEACFSTANLPIGYESLCDNGGPTDFGALASDPATCINKVIDPFEEEGCSHGTHVSGIAAGDDGTTLGVAPDALVLGVQVFVYDAWFDTTVAFDSDIISGLNWVYSQRFAWNIAAVNMSLGGGFYNNQTTCDNARIGVKSAIDNLRSVGIATVISSGNNGFTTGISGPGCISTAIAVGASDKFDVPAGFSNSHAMLDLYAPGVSIRSSVVFGGQYANWNGTSMAAPHVAGAWAIMKEAYDDWWGGNVPVESVLRAFQENGRSLVRSGVTRTRIDVGRAMRVLNGFTRPTTASALPGPWKEFNNEVFLTWTPLSWAERYEIQVDNTSSFASPEFATTVSTNSVGTPTLSDNTYFWRVRGVDLSFNPPKYGAWSPSTQFVIDDYTNQFP